MSISLMLANRKKIGEIHGTTAVFFVSARHWFQAGNGYSLDRDLVDHLPPEILHLQFVDCRAKNRETIPLATFRERAWLTKDYGFGRKLVCDSRFYDGHQPPHGSNPATTPALRPVENLQFDLFRRLSASLRA